MSEEIYTRLPPLKQKISDLLREREDSSEKYFELVYQESMTTNKYKITITLVEEDFFIDGKGRKWILASEVERVNKEHPIL